MAFESDLSKKLKEMERRINERTDDVFVGHVPPHGLATRQDVEDAKDTILEAIKELANPALEKLTEKLRGPTDELAKAVEQNK